ncbi:fimbrial protein [Rahnella sp. R3(2024)]|uniref:fimbrial protein n=1 Tax=unclassified Rahnella TaxID=2635087 RepID=UPI0036E7F486
MKLKFFQYVFLFVLINAINLRSYAADVMVSINGALRDQNCNVNSEDLTKNVVFSDLNTSAFKAPGNVSNKEEIDIGLDCLGTSSNISYQFTGEANELDPTLLKIKGQPNLSEPLAQGLAIEILDDKGNRIPLNTKLALGSPVTTEKYNLKFFLQYRAVAVPVLAGDASSVLFLDMYYD